MNKIESTIITVKSLDILVKVIMIMTQRNK